MDNKEIKRSRPVNEIIKIFAENTEESIKKNLVVQKIWPTEVYPGYAKVSRSTGEGAKSIDVDVISADDSGNITIKMGMASYMRFVDIGVARGRDVEDVRRSRKAKHLQRYVRRWSPETGESHRPFFLIEARHLQRRVGDFMSDFFGKEAQARLIEAFADLQVDLGI